MSGAVPAAVAVGATVPTLAWAAAVATVVVRHPDNLRRRRSRKGLPPG